MTADQPATATVTVTGPSVRTSVTFPPEGFVRLRLTGSDGVVELDRELVVALLAAGLQLLEPNRAGWVAIGELDVDDAIEFLIGATALDHDTALQAVARAVERAIELYVAAWRTQPPTAPADPPDPGRSE